MLSKTIRIISGIILVLLPFFPVTENFFKEIDNNNIRNYFIICGILVVTGVALAALLNYNHPARQAAGWALVLTGLAALYPLHLGAPKQDMSLLSFSAIEKSRYLVLLLSVALATIGFVLAARLLRPGLAKTGFLILVLLVAVANIWDNYSSFQFSTELQQWVNSGKNGDDFFPTYDFNMAWRMVARTGLYAAAIWLLLLLVKDNWIKKWQAAIIGLFSATGIAFCFLFLQKGFDYYFPFMVPAFALAPAYWIGICLLNSIQPNKPKQ